MKNIIVIFLISVEGEPLLSSDLLSSYISPPKSDTFGLDRVFMINLARRPERRKRMEHCFMELGLKATTVDAVDGR